MKRSSPPTSGDAGAGRSGVPRPGSRAGLPGLLGAMVIAGTLAVVRAWAWLTRTPFYKD